MKKKRTRKIVSKLVGKNTGNFGDWTYRLFLLTRYLKSTRSLFFATKQCTHLETYDQLYFKFLETLRVFLTGFVRCLCDTKKKSLKLLVKTFQRMYGHFQFEHSVSCSFGFVKVNVEIEQNRNINDLYKTSSVQLNVQLPDSQFSRRFIRFFFSSFFVFWYCTYDNINVKRKS